MKIRGAPAIGSLAALVLANILATSIASSTRPPVFATTESFLAYLQETTSYLNGARPTAVNLGEAMGRMYKSGEEAIQAGSTVDGAVAKVVDIGKDVHLQDLGRNILMSQNGADWISKVTGKATDIRILTVRSASLQLCFCAKLIGSPLSRRFATLDPSLLLAWVPLSESSPTSHRLVVLDALSTPRPLVRCCSRHILGSEDLY